MQNSNAHSRYFYEKRFLIPWKNSDPTTPVFELAFKAACYLKVVVTKDPFTTFTRNVPVPVEKLRSQLPVFLDAPVFDVHLKPSHLLWCRILTSELVPFSEFYIICSSQLHWQVWISTRKVSKLPFLNLRWVSADPLSVCNSHHQHEESHNTYATHNQTISRDPWWPMPTN